jgi:uncharacterized membrane protein
MNRDLRKIALLGIFTALVIVMTLIIRVPIPQTNGYINLGDSMILLGTMYFGGGFGAAIGAFGSAIADIVGGYSSFAPFTFVIKGIEGLIFGLLLTVFNKKDKILYLGISSIIATLWMVFGYFVVEVFKFKIAAALAELPGNLLQAAGSVIISISLYKILAKKVPSEYLE